MGGGVGGGVRGRSFRLYIIYDAMRYALDALQEVICLSNILSDHIELACRKMMSMRIRME